jgi:hypothetical protein
LAQEEEARGRAEDVEAGRAAEAQREARLEVREEAAQEAAEAPPEHLKAELQKLVDELQKHKDCEKGSSSRPTSALKLQAGGGEGRPREQETQMCR